MNYKILTLIAVSCLSIGFAGAMSEKEKQDLAKKLQQNSYDAFQNALIEIVKKDPNNSKGTLFDVNKIVQDNRRGKMLFERVLKHVLNNQAAFDTVMAQLKAGRGASNAAVQKEKIEQLKEKNKKLKLYIQQLINLQTEEAKKKGKEVPKADEKKIKDLEEQLKDLQAKLDAAAQQKNLSDNQINDLKQKIKDLEQKLKDANPEDAAIKQIITNLSEAIVAFDGTQLKGDNNDEAAYIKAKADLQNALNEYVDKVKSKEVFGTFAPEDQQQLNGFEQDANTALKKMFQKIDQSVLDAQGVIVNALDKLYKVAKAKSGETEADFNQATQELQNAINAYELLKNAQGYTQEQADEAKKVFTKVKFMGKKEAIVDNDKQNFMNALNGINVAAIEAKAANGDYGHEGASEVQLNAEKNLLSNQIKGLANYAKYQNEKAVTDKMAQINAIKLPKKEVIEEEGAEALLKNKVFGGKLPVDLKSAESQQTIIDYIEENYKNIGKKGLQDLKDYLMKPEIGWKQQDIDAIGLDNIIGLL